MRAHTRTLGAHINISSKTPFAHISNTPFQHRIDDKDTQRTRIWTTTITRTQIKAGTRIRVRTRMITGTQTRLKDEDNDKSENDYEGTDKDNEETTGR